MSKGEIATFIVCWIEAFICYLIGYTIGITHDKRTITHECIKDTHDDPEPQKWETPPKFEHKGEVTTCVSVPVFLIKDALIEDEPQTEVNALYEQIVEDIDTRVKCANAKKVEDEPQTERNE